MATVANAYQLRRMQLCGSFDHVWQTLDKALQGSEAAQRRAGEWIDALGPDHPLSRRAPKPR